MSNEIDVLYDENLKEVPLLWRDTIWKIVEAFKNNDINFFNQIEGVKKLTLVDFEEIISDINVYGETLVSLPSEAWESSQCLWRGDSCWHVYIDLYTINEGKSDLILFLIVELDENNHFHYDVSNFYVP